jgi:hypothetical protein
MFCNGREKLKLSGKGKGTGTKSKSEKAGKKDGISFFLC